VVYPVNNLAPGQYIYSLHAGPLKVSNKLTIVE
jgi:hypothetical protein